jgi:hypothetical protein
LANWQTGCEYQNRRLILATAQIAAHFSQPLQPQQQDWSEDLTAALLQISIFQKTSTWRPAQHNMVHSLIPFKEKPHNDSLEN